LMDMSISDSSQPLMPQERIASIDALRGFDMFWIIGGGAFFESLSKVWKNPFNETIKIQMEHVSWDGFHFEDLIFPLFLFIVGVVLPFSISRRREQGVRPGAVRLHIIKRAVVLILLGLILNGLLQFNLADMRWPGVLQRIGLCYFFAALIVLHTGWRIQAFAAGGLLLGYWALVILVPTPGFGAGVLTPEGCLPAYIDRLLIPGKFCCFTYGDNEGLLSTIPAVSTVLIGALAGHWLRAKFSGNLKTAVMIVAGVICLIIGYLWGHVFPIIKVIWTSSYVLYAAGWSLLLLAAFYWLIDVMGFKKWAFFFVVIGVNPITIYFLQGIVNFDDIAAFFVRGFAHQTGQFELLILPFAAFAAKWLLLLFLYRHKIFFKV
jgi:predicted acyltransferase